MCTGFCTVETFPSPKFHNQAVIVSPGATDASVKFKESVNCVNVYAALHGPGLMFTVKLLQKVSATQAPELAAIITQAHCAPAGKLFVIVCPTPLAPSLKPQLYVKLVSLGK